jgi:hypothetical protein
VRRFINEGEDKLYRLNDYVIALVQSKGSDSIASTGVCMYIVLRVMKLVSLFGIDLF